MVRALPRMPAGQRACYPEEVPADREKNDGMLKTNGGSDESETGSSHW